MTPTAIEPVAERWTAYLQSLKRLAPVQSNRASELGFPCLRYNWYQRTRYEAAALPDDYLQGVFAFGQDYEEMLRRRLQAAGYRLRAEQVTEIWREYNITGHPEGELSWDEGQTWHLYEIKGLHPNYYNRIHEWRDFLKLGPLYGRYPAQGQIYMLLRNRERMLWLLGKKGTYDVKWLWMELDYDLAESYLRKAERINRIVENGPEPPKQPDDPAACGVCAFKLTCLPDQDYGPGAELLDDEDLLEDLRRRDALATSRREFEALDKAIKARIGKRPLALCGEYRIEGKEVEVKAYEVPARKDWRLTIRSTKGSGETA